MKNDTISEKLEAAIPRGMSSAIADDISICVRQVQRWRSGDEPSPAHAFIRLFRAVYLNNPTGAAILFELVEREYRNLQHTHGERITRTQRAASILKEAVEAVNALNLNAADSETLRELVELRAVIDAAISEIGGQQLAS